MGRRDIGLPSLGERSARMAAREAKPSGPAHCWVLHEAGNRHPGILLEWRQSETGWAGPVSYAVTGDGGAFSLVQMWIRSDSLRPA